MHDVSMVCIKLYLIISDVKKKKDVKSLRFLTDDAPVTLCFQ